MWTRPRAHNIHYLIWLLLKMIKVGTQCGFHLVHTGNETLRSRTSCLKLHSTKVRTGYMLLAHCHWGMVYRCAHRTPHYGTCIPPWFSGQVNTTVGYWVSLKTGTLLLICTMTHLLWGCRSAGGVCPEDVSVFNVPQSATWRLAVASPAFPSPCPLDLSQHPCVCCF